MVHGDVGGSSLSSNFVTLGECISHFGSKDSRDGRSLRHKGGGTGEAIAVHPSYPLLHVRGRWRAKLSQSRGRRGLVLSSDPTATIVGEVAQTRIDPPMVLLTDIVGHSKTLDVCIWAWTQHIPSSIFCVCVGGVSQW
jgi:hypothetical protein